ncbi:unnamed protein product [Urochloa decumbens]|uniref:BHLH domain-containing protein n=1 Tax=Urochloa decumbens TaxID=240449 RepID=A0ABC8VNN1_9POAL
MADEWWSSARAGDGESTACSMVPATGQNATESAETSATSTDYFRHAGAATSLPSFLADPSPQHMVDWTQAYMGGGRAAAEGTAGFNDALQFHGQDAGRHCFLLEQQPRRVVDGAAPVAAAAAEPSRSASLYGDIMYSSYGGDVPEAPMTTTTKKTFSQQHFSAGAFFGSSPRNFSGVPPSVPPPAMTTAKPLVLQALEQEQKAFKSHNEHVHQDACSSATRSVVPDSPPAAKKPRIATPSPLPTFKVRKEKLGDRITALQQLVSPFGKTDTASVLHEAIEYIRFLHDQVASLSSQYLRCGRPVQQLRQKQAKDGGEAKEDLRSRGLCLVPVASTYAVASETAPEFWHPTFGGTFR